MIVLNAVKWYRLSDFLEGDELEGVRVAYRPWDSEIGIEADSHAERAIEGCPEGWRDAKRIMATYAYIFERLLVDWEGVADFSNDTAKAEPNVANAHAFLTQVPPAFEAITKTVDEHTTEWIREKKVSKPSANGKQKAESPTAKPAPSQALPAPEAKSAPTGNGALTSSTAL